MPSVKVKVRSCVPHALLCVALSSHSTTPTSSRGSSPTRLTRAISWSYSCSKLNDTPTFSRRSSRGCRRGCRRWCRRRGMRALRCLAAPRVMLRRFRYIRLRVAAAPHARHCNASGVKELHLPSRSSISGQQIQRYSRARWRIFVFALL